jgi:hypothetical protein
MGVYIMAKVKGKKSVRNSDFIAACVADANAGGTMEGTANRLGLVYGSFVQRRSKIVKGIKAANAERAKQNLPALPNLPDYKTAQGRGAKPTDYSALANLIPTE